MKTKLLFACILLYTGIACAQYRAVVCGITNYPTASYGPYCAADAKAISHHLKNLPNWGGADVTTLIDQAATKNAIYNAIDDMAASALSSDICVFFFSGRSATNLICAYDADITFNELASRIAYMPAGKYVILIDMGLPKSTTVTSSLIPVHYTGTSSQGMSILSYYQYLDDPLYDVTKNSPFTYMLLEALSGYGDTNYDGYISAQECAYFVDPDDEYTRVVDYTAGVAISTTAIAYNDIYETDTSTSNDIIPVDGTPIMRAIKPAYELDYLHFTLSTGATVTIETNSSLESVDTVVYLYKTSVSTLNLIAQNDDNPDSDLDEYYLSKLTRTLSAGTYYLKIKEYSTDTIDSYTVRVSPQQMQLFVTGPDFIYGGSTGEYKSYIDSPIDGTQVASQWSSDNPAAWFSGAVLYSSQVSADTPANITAYYNGTSSQKQVTVRAAAMPGESVNYYAVVCGIADYPGTENDLEYADDDALAIRNQLLADPHWKTANITLLINSQATYSAISSAIANMAARADSDDVCLLFYSGHGTTVSDSYPYDESDGEDECLYVYDTTIRDDVFGQWVNNLPTDNYIVLIDCCYSGGQIKAADISPQTAVKGIGKAKTASGDGFAADIASAVIGIDDLNDNGRGIVLTASDDDELSWENTTFAQGVFTHYLLGAMSGSADSNDDGFVSAEECYSYIYPLALEDQHTQIYDAAALAMPVMQYDSQVYVSSISIAGQSTLEPESSYNYTCTANYSDGSFVNITNSVKWQLVSSDAVITQSGLLTTGAVGSNAALEIKAVYNNLYSDVFNAVIPTARYSGGDGTAQSPFLISTRADLASICGYASDWGSCFLLAADIDMTGVAFTPIGINWDSPFLGSFDGGGHEIRNLSINTATDYAGLFGILDFGASVIDVGLFNAAITGGNCTGPIAGWSNGIISGCFATGCVSGNMYVGGIAGGISGSEAGIEDCYSLCSVYGSNWAAGITGIAAGGASVSRTLAAAAVQSPASAAPITNYYEANKITACFYDELSINASDNGAGVPISGEQLKTADIFINAGWDFSETGNWKIKAGYAPLLKWQVDFTPYDFNNDGVVNSQDIVIFAASWLGSDAEICDISQYGGDGIVDLKDFAILCIYWLDGE